MKTSSATGKPKRSVAVSCLLINQFATPGLGSLGAKRYVAGTIQLILAVIGFSLFVGWFVELMIKVWHEASDMPSQPDASSWMLKAGLIIFAISWVLAWFTSISVWKESKKQGNAVDTIPAVPPKIDGSAN